MCRANRNRRSAMHRVNDPMYSILISQPTTPAQMLDVSQFYTYDLLPSTA
jgi:hypothetical protein